MHKDNLRQTVMVGDPIAVVEEYGLVNRHDPHTRKLVGAWRWPGLFENRGNLRPLLARAYKIDLGGLAGPIGYGSIIVDYDDPHNKALWDLPGRANVIFASHVVEHVEDIDLFLACCAAKLTGPGHMVILCPSHRTPRLQHRNWPFHRHTFHLPSDEAEAPRDSECLVSLVAEYFSEILLAEYTSDDQIIIIAQTEVE